MKIPAFITLLTTFCCSNVFAQTNDLIIGDSEISWSDSGWYQVLALPDYRAVCEGGSRCEVEAGQYLVINHTTGMRWAPVIVGSELPGNTGNPDANVTVNGSIISWPDDGWYQVQSLSDYSVFCEGTRFCDVPVGDYVVINHTTGERTEPVSVTVDSSTETSPRPLVANGVISWADDGWYQVQDAISYSTICEGGSTCSVQAGQYIVINLTTGMRWEDVDVSGGTTVLSEPVRTFLHELVQTAAIPVYELNLSSLSGTEIDPALLGCAQPADVRNPPLTAYYGSLNCVDMPLYLVRQSFHGFIQIDQSVFDGFGDAIEAGEQSDGSINCTSAGQAAIETCQLNALTMTIPLVWVQSPSTGSQSCIACGIRPIFGSHIEFDFDQSNILTFTPDAGSASLSVNYRCVLDTSTGSLRESSPVPQATNCLTEMNNLTTRLQEFRLADQLADSVLLSGYLGG